MQIGPLDVVVGDPFGLTTLATVAAPRSRSRCTRTSTRSTRCRTRRGTTRSPAPRQPNSLGRTGEDFYALRPYVVGDDLRRIHWPSSARHDELLVRQNELPWQGRTTVLLDVRKAAHTGDSLEVAVSAAASIVAATARRHDLIRLVTSAGSDSDFAPGSDHVEAIMEHLAIVPAAPTGSLRRSVEMLGRRSTGGAARRHRGRGAAAKTCGPPSTCAAATARSPSCTSTARRGTPARRSAPPPEVPALRVTRDDPVRHRRGTPTCARRRGADRVRGGRAR